MPELYKLSLTYLESLPTLAVGPADDLKVEGPGYRIWLSRCTPIDGEPYNNKVTEERLINGRWVVTRTYPAR